MSTVERKEYQETKVMRSVSPVRNWKGSRENLAQFDNNLDYLLEDLQNSVSRPGSALGNTHTSRSMGSTLDSRRSNSLNRYNNVKSANPVTEYSSDDAYNYTSPDGRKHVTGYKKESYSYKANGAPAQPLEKVRVQNSINQLDTLLDDLQQVKNSSFLEKESYNNVGADPAPLGGNKLSSSSKSVQRELHYGDTPRSNSRGRTLEREYTSEGTYGDIRQIRTSSPSPSSRTSTLSKQTKVTNVHAYPLETVETTTPDINPEILAHLDPNLHPPGNTKVTTTIKTYTYEIPGSGPYPTNLVDSGVDTVDQKFVYSPSQTLPQGYSPNTSQTTPSKSFVYSKVENKENTVNYRTTPTPPPPHSVVKETVTTRNYQPGYSPELDRPKRDQTYVYNETVTTRNLDDGYPPIARTTPVSSERYFIKEEEHKEVRNEYPVNPPRQERYFVKEEEHKEIRNEYPVNPPRQERYFIKEEEHREIKSEYPVNPPRHDTVVIKEVHDNTTSVHHPYPNGYPPNEPNTKTVIYKHESHTTNNFGPGRRPPDAETFDPKYPPYGSNRRPNEPVNIQYKYKSESTTTNNYKTGLPPRDETQVLLPKPFPTDQHPEGPPKRLDDLMANIGQPPPNSPYNAGFNAHEQELEHKKKIDTLKLQQSDAEDLQKKEPVQRSKNVSGPPVYYPPGHEMFAKKEEGAAWRAEGAYGKESGKYKYEAESKSKGKSSSGAAIVPVCLPLCCGLPCSII